MATGATMQEHHSKPQSELGGGHVRHGVAVVVAVRLHPIHAARARVGGVVVTPRDGQVEDPLSLP